MYSLSMPCGAKPWHDSVTLSCDAFIRHSHDTKCTDSSPVVDLPLEPVDDDEDGGEGDSGSQDGGQHQQPAGKVEHGQNVQVGLDRPAIQEILCATEHKFYSCCNIVTALSADMKKKSLTCL